jgi:predicted HNH restriction endonuclease
MKNIIKKITNRFIKRNDTTFEDLLIKLNSKALCVRGFNISTYIGGKPTERMYQISYKSASTFAIDEQEYRTKHYFDIKEAMQEFIDWRKAVIQVFTMGLYIYTKENQEKILQMIILNQNVNFSIRAQDS